MTDPTVAPQSRTARVLIAYASEFGSTSEVAEVIAEVLREGGASVEIHPVMDINGVDTYDAVVVGSPIFNGAWLPDAALFVQQFQDQLAAMPVALFALSMTMRNDTPENRQTVLSYLQPVLQSTPGVRPIGIGLFGGRLHYRNLPLTTRLIFWLRTLLPSGDFRDWKTVRTWAEQMRPSLLQGRSGTNSAPSTRP